MKIKFLFWEWNLESEQEREREKKNENPTMSNVFIVAIADADAKSLFNAKGIYCLLYHIWFGMSLTELEKVLSNSVTKEIVA